MLRKWETYENIIVMYASATSLTSPLSPLPAPRCSSTHPSCFLSQQPTLSPPQRPAIYLLSLSHSPVFRPIPSSSLPSLPFHPSAPPPPLPPLTGKRMFPECRARHASLAPQITAVPSTPTPCAACVGGGGSLTVGEGRG